LIGALAAVGASMAGVVGVGWVSLLDRMGRSWGAMVSMGVFGVGVGAGSDTGRGSVEMSGMTASNSSSGW
jgi:hypothetical protein